MLMQTSNKQICHLICWAHHRGDRERCVKEKNIGVSRGGLCVPNREWGGSSSRIHWQLQVHVTEQRVRVVHPVRIIALLWVPL